MEQGLRLADRQMEGGSGMSGPGASAHATRPEGFARVFSQAQSGQTPARPCGCPLSNIKNAGEPGCIWASICTAAIVGRSPARGINEKLPVDLVWRLRASAPHSPPPRRQSAPPKGGSAPITSTPGLLPPRTFAPDSSCARVPLTSWGPVRSLESESTFLFHLDVLIFQLIFPAHRASGPVTGGNEL